VARIATHREWSLMVVTESRPSERNYGFGRTYSATGRQRSSLVCPLLVSTQMPFPRRTRRSPNHLPRVVDVQSSAKVPPGSTPRFCISVALLHRNARTPRGPFEYPTTSPALLIAVASLEVSPGNVPRLRTLADFRPQNCTIAAYGFHRSHDLIRVIDVASFAITAARQSTEILNARPCRPQESFYAIRT